jgi:hypothetical protein
MRRVVVAGKAPSLGDGLHTWPLGDRFERGESSKVEVNLHCSEGRHFEELGEEGISGFAVSDHEHSPSGMIGDDVVEARMSADKVVSP